MKCTLLALLVVLCWSSTWAKTWYVKPDGTGDAPTIGAAIDSAAAGDRVLVAAGTYADTSRWSPEGTAMLIMKSGITLISESGPYSTNLDGGGVMRVIICAYADSNTVVDGFTIRNGYATGTPDRGGGLYCYYASPKVANCEFVENVAEYGGAIACSNCDHARFANCNFYDNQSTSSGGAVEARFTPARIVNCSFVNNTASHDGGGLRLFASDGVVVWCRFLGNQAGHNGGGISCLEDESSITSCSFCLNEASLGSGISFSVESSSTVGNNIIVFGVEGNAVDCAVGAPAPVLACCDIFGNAGGDWTGCIADQLGIDGNFSADPLFCDIVSADLTMEECSPCVAGNHPYGFPCGTIGADQPGCGCGETTDGATWGAIKALYR